MINRLGKVMTVGLVVIWIGTVVLVIDTRRNFTNMNTREADCPCGLQPSSLPGSVSSNSSDLADSEPRTVVKRLRYCRHEKNGGPVRNDSSQLARDGKKQKPANGQSNQRKPVAPGKQRVVPQRRNDNPHPYYFTMQNPDACKQSTNANGYVDALCLVPTSPSDSPTRSLIRKTWGSAKLVKGKRIVTMFLLGKRDMETQHLLELENNRYHDIIQENLWDSYYNLTLKTLMGLRWAARFCPNARYIMKVGVDMFVNVYNLVDRLDSAPTLNFAEGNLMKDVYTEPIRNKQSEWFKSRDVYPNKTHPPYLDAGPTYLMSGDLSARIFGTSLHERFLPWEDAYDVRKLMRRIHVDAEYNGRYASYLDYSNMQETLWKISESIAVHLGEDKEENKENILMVWNYVRKLNDIPVLD